MSETRPCSRCGRELPPSEFYFVSKKLGTLRGQCKDCMRDLKAAQRDPAWRPSCIQCGASVPRMTVGGRRLCTTCHAERYSSVRRENGSHRKLLAPCRSCGAPRLREETPSRTTLCGVCRSVPQSRRNRLKNVFNMTPLEYSTLLDMQNYSCAVCSKPFTRKGFGPDAHIDHRHAEPSIIRAVLCNTCNLLLAMARDRVEVLRAAADMLDAPPAQKLMPGRVAHPAANERKGYVRGAVTR